MKPNTKDWGVIEFAVTTDQTRNIEHVCAIALSGHRRVSHYQVVTLEDGSNVLYLFWIKSNHNIELPFELDNAAAMAQFISTWLAQKAVYPDDTYGGDGDSQKGVRIANFNDRRDKDVEQFYVVAVVEPDWIIYSK